MVQVLSFASKKVRGPFLKKIIRLQNLAFLLVIISLACIIPAQLAYAVSYTFSSPFLNLSSTANGSSPQIVVSGSNIYVVWKDTTTGSGDIYYERSTDGGATFNGGTTSTPGTPVNLSNNAGVSSSPQIAVSGSDVYVVWSDQTSPSGIYFSRSTDGGATFNGGTTSTPGSPTVLSSATGVTATPQIAASGSNVVVVWRGSLPSPGAIFYESSSNSGSSFNTATSGAAINLSSGVSGAPVSPQVAISGSYVHVVWQQGTPADIYYSRSTDGGATFNGGTTSTPGTPVNLSFNTGASNFPKIAVSGANVYVVWQDKTVDSSGDIYFSVSNDNGATFNGGTPGSPGSPVNISQSTGVTSTTPVVAASGTVVHVAWQETGISTGNMYYARGATSSTSISLDAQQYTLSNTATVTITSLASNLNNNAIDTIQATVTSTTDSRGITVTLSETGVNTGVFTGQFTFTTGSSSGTSLQAKPGDTITVTFGGQTGTASIYPRTVAFAFSVYTMSSIASVTVTDQNSITNPSVVETIPITVSSTTDPSGVSLTLTETGAGTGVFTSSNLIFTTGNAQFSVGDKVIVTQSETSGGHLTDNTIDTLPVTVASTSDPAGITMTLSETQVNTGSFSGILQFTIGLSSSTSNPNTLHVAAGDIVSITYLGETAHGLVIPNSNSGLNTLPAKIGDTITASYLGATGTTIINPGSGGGGGGGGLVRPGLVLDVLAAIGGSPPSEPPVFFDKSSIPINSLPKDIQESILNPDPNKPIPPVQGSKLDFPLEIDGEGFYLPLHANTISTVTETVGRTFHLRLEMQDSYDVVHVSLFTNLSGQTSRITDSDTAIIYDKGKPLMIMDPHNFFSNVTLSETQNDTKYAFDYAITFAKPMQRSDIYLRSWNQLLGSSDMDILDALQVNGSQNTAAPTKNIAPSTLVNMTHSEGRTSNGTTPIINLAPSSNATMARPDPMTAVKEWGGYSPESISDAQLLHDMNLTGYYIPPWVMKTTKWVVDGTMSMQEFTDVLRYLHDHNITK